MAGRLGYGELEEEILGRFNPYKGKEYTAETLWSGKPLHERVLDPVRLSKAVEQLIEVERETVTERKKMLEARPKVQVRRLDLDRFYEETGLRGQRAEEFFIVARGNLEEALMIWVNHTHGEPLKPLLGYDDPTLDLTSPETRRDKTGLQKSE
jgi:hypothetical protein